MASKSEYRAAAEAAKRALPVVIAKGDIEWAVVLTKRIKEYEKAAA